MPYLQFQSLGDGNCLYNTQAVWLIYAYQQQLLAPLFANEQARNNFAKLMIILGEQNPQFGLPRTLAEINSVQTLQTAFDTYIAHLTTNNGIDWIRVQLTLARALRAFVVDTIKTDPTTNAAIKANLTTYLEGIAQTTHELSSLQEGIRAVRLEFTNHFSESNYVIPDSRSTRIVAEIKEIIENEFNDFINTKMGTSVEKREQIINNVKEEIKRVVTNAITSSRRRAVHTMREEVLEALRTHLATVIKNDMADDTMTFSAHFQGMPQIENAIKIVIRSTLPTVEQQKQVLTNWFFNNEATGFNLYLSNQGGIGTNTVDAGELEQKVLSHAFNHIILIKSLKHEHQVPRVVNGLLSSDDSEVARNYPADSVIFEMEKLPGHWNALLPDNENTKRIMEAYGPQRSAHIERIFREQTRQELILKIRQHGNCEKHRTTEMPDMSIDQYCAMYGISQTEYQAPAQAANPLSGVTPGQESRGAFLPNAPLLPQQYASGLADQERDWMGYGMMLIAMVAILAVISHGIVWPIIAPLVEFFLPGSAALFWAQLGSCALFSSLFGFVLTEKIFSDGEETTPIDPPMTNATTASTPVASGASWWPTSLLPSFLFHRQAQNPQATTNTTTTPAAVNPTSSTTPTPTTVAPTKTPTPTAEQQRQSATL